MILAPVTAGDHADIAALLDDCFGPERHLRTAYRLREQATSIGELSRLIRAHDGRLLGSIQYWRLELVTASTAYPLVLLGPLAVTPAARRHGVGRRLMDATLALADAAEWAPVLLIGDPGYYGRFGFSAATTGGWRLSGPIEPHRLLLRNNSALALPVDAEVRGSRSASIVPHAASVARGGGYTRAATV